MIISITCYFLTFPNIFYFPLNHYMIMNVNNLTKIIYNNFTCAIKYDEYLLITEFVNGILFKKINFLINLLLFS